MTGLPSVEEWYDHMDALNRDYGTFTSMKQRPQLGTETRENMNATDFGKFNDDDHTRGICMWTWDGEWCAIPVVVEDYNGKLNLPRVYEYGNLFGIHVPEGLPEYNSMWICSKHRLDFLKLNSRGNHGQSIWEIDHKGKGSDVTYIPLHEVSVRIRSNMSSADLSKYFKGQLTDLMRVDDTIEAWSYMKIREVE